MSKPVLFFSHSSKDSAQLSFVKDLFTERFAGAIDIFQSSDKESIPLGKNWLREIEEHLKMCRLAIAFVSPNSIGSPWLPFEVGFIYSRGVPVVVAALNGLTFGHVPFPLSILQGIELTDESKLNELIASINCEFDLSAKTDVDESQWAMIRSLAPIPSEPITDTQIIINQLTTIQRRLSLEALAEDEDHLINNYHSDLIRYELKIRGRDIVSIMHDFNSVDIKYQGEILGMNEVDAIRSVIDHRFPGDFERLKFIRSKS